MFGGVSAEGLRFCSQNCAAQAQLAIVGQTLPEREVRKHVWDVYKGQCPKCGGAGPTDIRTSYRVISVVVLTRWSSHPVLACRGCGIKSQLLDLVVCLLFGWWGFPWGVLLTPVQVVRNLIPLLSSDDGTPTEALDRVVRTHLAAELVAAQAEQSQPGQPQPALPRAS
ncbi:MAG TPA: hypothetical protein VNN80_21540 [Polyangiaceae bacterium]|nr:hypothetical protein [Polyangiaceae bacterium]